MRQLVDHLEAVAGPVGRAAGIAIVAASAAFLVGYALFGPLALHLMPE